MIFIYFPMNDIVRYEFDKISPVLKYQSYNTYVAKPKV